MKNQIKAFKPGQVVLYMPTDPNGEVYKMQAGIVKRMRDDGKVAFIWYHSGCTAASTPVEYLQVSPKLRAHSFIHTGCVECSTNVGGTKR